MVNARHKYFTKAYSGRTENKINFLLAKEREISNLDVENNTQKELNSYPANLEYRMSS
jgi:hypothetical protein